MVVFRRLPTPRSPQSTRDASSQAHLHPVVPLLTSVFALAIAFGAHAQVQPAPAPPEEKVDLGADPQAPIEPFTAPRDVPPPEDLGTGDPLEADMDMDMDMGADTDIAAGGLDEEIEIDVGTDPLPDLSLPADAGAQDQVMTIDMDFDAGDEEDGRFAAWKDAFRISLLHEVSYKFASPKRFVNNRSGVRLEFSKLFARNLFLRLDTKYNLHWNSDHRTKAKNENLFRELITREAYLQTSFGETSLRVGYQILPWGVSEGGAITDEVSPRNSADFFFVPLEESRIGQPMLALDHFGRTGQWSAFFVPRPAYNRYPDSGSEYDIPGAFEVEEPEGSWDDTDDFEYGLRWKRTFDKSDFSLMAASLIENDYLVRKQRMQMVGMAANIADDNLLYRAEVALKHPRVFFAQNAAGDGFDIVESDVFDSSFGFDYSPGGRSLIYSAEIIWSRLLDWRSTIVGRERDEYGLVGSVSNRFFNDDLTLSWLMIYNEPYTSFQHKFLSTYLIDDNSTFFLELFYPDERDSRSGTWPHRNEKQIVVRYQYQF